MSRTPITSNAGKKGTTLRTLPIDPDPESNELSKYELVFPESVEKMNPGNVGGAWFPLPVQLRDEFLPVPQTGDKSKTLAFKKQSNIKFVPSCPTHFPFGLSKPRKDTAKDLLPQNGNLIQAGGGGVSGGSDKPDKYTLDVLLEEEAQTQPKINNKDTLASYKRMAQWIYEENLEPFLLKNPSFIGWCDDDDECTIKQVRKEIRNPMYLKDDKGQTIAPHFKMVCKLIAPDLIMKRQQRREDWLYNPSVQGGYEPPPVFTNANGEAFFMSVFKLDPGTNKRIFVDPWQYVGMPDLVAIPELSIGSMRKINKNVYIPVEVIALQICDNIPIEKTQTAESVSDAKKAEKIRKLQEALSMGAPSSSSSSSSSSSTAIAGEKRPAEEIEEEELPPPYDECCYQQEFSEYRDAPSFTNTTITSSVSVEEKEVVEEVEQEVCAPPTKRRKQNHKIASIPVPVNVDDFFGE